MKKNILTIIILAATLVNLTLSALMLFVYLPNAQKMNTMITKVCQAITLELENPLPPSEEDAVAATDLETILIGTNMPINLTSSEGMYYAQVTASVVLNKKAEGYKTVQPLIEPQAELIKEIIQEKISVLTIENFQTSKAIVRQEILETLQQKYDTECIYDVVFGNYTMMH